MAEKLTTYDPAEDLTSTGAATFRAEAFETKDAGYIAHGWASRPEPRA